MGRERSGCTIVQPAMALSFSGTEPGLIYQTAAAVVKSHALVLFVTLNLDAKSFFDKVDSVLGTNSTRVIHVQEQASSDYCRTVIHVSVVETCLHISKSSLVYGIALWAEPNCQTQLERDYTFLNGGISVLTVSFDTNCKLHFLILWPVLSAPCAIFNFPAPNSH